MVIPTVASTATHWRHCVATVRRFALPRPLGIGDPQGEDGPAVARCGRSNLAVSSFKHLNQIQHCLILTKVKVVRT